MASWWSDSACISATGLALDSGLDTESGGGGIVVWASRRAVPAVSMASPMVTA
jgi:hypothetical protein